MLYAIKNFNHDGFITNKIYNSSVRAGEMFLEMRRKEYDIITDVVKVKTAQVVMPNGHKAVTYIVEGETWMMYRDGSCEIVKAALAVEAKTEKRVAKPTKKAVAFFNASNNFEEFAAQMSKDGYNEKYTLIQWNLCK